MKEIERLFEQLQDGQISDSDLQRLKELAAENPEYDEMLRLHQQLTEGDASTPLPAESEFMEMRNRVLHAIDDKAKNRASFSPPDYLEKLKLFFLKPEMAVAALTLIVGFFLGRVFPDSEGGFTGSLLHQINQIAQTNTRLVDLENSPYYYSNVSFRDIDGENISLSFDVSTHLDVVRPKNDPLVREIIAQALLNPSNVGSELKAISYSESLVDKKIKEALIFSAQNTPILAVRLKALSSLVKYENDKQVEDAFLDILREEESVKMQMIALDYLEASHIDPDSLEAALEQSDTRRSPAIEIKAKKYIYKK